MSPLLDVRDVAVSFAVGGGLFRKPILVRAVNEVTFAIQRGEVLAIVGESGCGKTTLARTLLGIQPPTAGSIMLQGEPLSKLSRRQAARHIQPVFQDPYSSLNPRKTLADIIALPLQVRGEMSAAEIGAAVAGIMDLVGLNKRLTHAYPNQLSGGQRQRVAIARALVARPDLVICDEPTSALDVSVQAQILNLLQDLKQELNLTYIFISHNLSVVRHFADRVAVMYLGRVVELGPVTDVLGDPLHPYTRKLKDSVLPPDPDHVLPPVVFDGGFPDPTDPPGGCHFHPRCPCRIAVCDTRRPESVHHASSTVACHLYPALAAADGNPHHQSAEA